MTEVGLYGTTVDATPSPRGIEATGAGGMSSKRRSWGAAVAKATRARVGAKRLMVADSDVEGVDLLPKKLY